MKKKESFIRGLLLFFALASIIFLLGIVIILFSEGLSLFSQVSIKDFLTGKYWYPTHSQPEFGILPLLIATLWVTLGSLLIAVPIGVGGAIYIAEVAPPRLKEFIKPVVELLANIPSVVYGLFGMIFLAPWIQKTFALPTGLTALTGTIVLGIMALPTIVSIAEDAISSVPYSYKEASYSLGANKVETIIKIILPAASSGVITAIILGMGRAIGETMTVLMVCGGAAVIPHTFLQPVRPMTATIAAEMGEAVVGSLHYHALFAIALVLFILTFIFNLIADFFTERFRRKMRLT